VKYREPDAARQQTTNADVNTSVIVMKGGNQHVEKMGKMRTAAEWVSDDVMIN
jgi:hypothetical protein